MMEAMRNSTTSVNLTSIIGVRPDGSSKNQMAIKNPSTIMMGEASKLKNRKWTGNWPKMGHVIKLVPACAAIGMAKVIAAFDD